MKTTYVGAWLEPELRLGLNESARLNERSLSAEVRLAIRRHLEPTDEGAGRGVPASFQGGQDECTSDL